MINELVFNFIIDLWLKHNRDKVAPPFLKIEVLFEEVCFGRWVCSWYLVCLGERYHHLVAQVRNLSLI